jgi:glycine cleavage system transcriptional repressor
MTDYLVISALGTDKPGIINALSKQAAAHHCNIHDTRMTVLGGEFSLMMLVSGSADDIDRLEPALKDTAESLDLTVMLKHTAPKDDQDQNLPYSVEVVSLDHPGIVHEIAGFFGDKAINIEEMHTGTYAAPHTGTQMFSLQLTVNVPSGMPLSKLKEEFVGFCDEKNLDASIEAFRGNR